MFLKSRIIDHFFLQIVHCELGPPRGGKSGYIFSSGEQLSQFCSLQNRIINSFYS